MTLTERLRNVPPRWYAVGASALVLVLIITVAIASGGGDDRRLATTDPTSQPDTSTSDQTTAGTALTATTPSASGSTTTTTNASTPLNTIDLDDEYDLDIDDDDPAVVARPIPDEPDPDEPPPTTIAPPPWAWSTRTTEGGYLGTDVGCATGLSANAIDAFFAERVGPVLGWDYQHVYPLGGDRYLWLFQDAFVDHSGAANTLGKSRFTHNVALLQTGKCFTLLHRGSATRPGPFEPGIGDGNTPGQWFWPMGGEVSGGSLRVFWAEMIKDPYDPKPPNGLGWHPRRTFVATYDLTTLRRTAFDLAPNSGVAPIYGYAVSSDATHSYLFGNTFEQNMIREGGFWNGPHSGTKMWLARVPRGQLAAAPEYRTADGWSTDATEAVPIVDRFYAENPMQPRYLDGQWIAVTAVDGYWGDHLAVDVAIDPWGPWHTVRYDPLPPRGGDPKMNTYHAHLLPWRDDFGSALISVSNNARNMLRDAWPQPHRYRPNVIFAPFVETPQPTTTTSTTTTSTTTTSTTTTLAPTTTMAPTTTTTSTPTTTTTTTAPTTTTTSTPTTTTTTMAPTTTTTSTPTTSSTVSSSTTTEP